MPAVGSVAIATRPMNFCIPQPPSGVVAARRRSLLLVSAHTVPPRMRLTWSQHLAAARTIELAGDDQCGTAMALMGVACLLLLQDLSDTAERPDPA